MQYLQAKVRLHTGRIISSVALTRDCIGRDAVTGMASILAAGV